MPEIAVSGPHVTADVGHFRVSVDFGDRLVDFDPSFEIVGLSNALRSRTVSKDVCAQTANALVKAHVPLDTVLMVISRLTAQASPEILRGLEPTE